MELAAFVGKCLYWPGCPIRLGAEFPVPLSFVPAGAMTTDCTFLGWPDFHAIALGMVANTVDLSP